MNAKAPRILLSLLTLAECTSTSQREAKDIVPESTAAAGAATAKPWLGDPWCQLDTNNEATDCWAACE